jgi:hypothetical protein
VFFSDYYTDEMEELAARLKVDPGELAQATSVEFQISIDPKTNTLVDRRELSNGALLTYDPADVCLLLTKGLNVHTFILHHRNCITATMPGIRTMIECLPLCETLTTVCIGEINSMARENMETYPKRTFELLATKLPLCPNLTRLNFSTWLTADFIRPFTAELRNLPHLHVFTANGSYLTYIGLANLAANFSKCSDAQMANLRELTLCNVSMDRTEPQSLYAKFDAQIGRLTGLIYLDLSKNVLTPESIESIGASLSKCTQLQKLNVSNCQLNHTSALALARVLRSCSSLRELNISDNPLIDPTLPSGAPQPAQTAVCDFFRELGHVASLRTLQIGNTNLNSRTLQVLGDNLPQLRHLSLKGSRVTPEFLIGLSNVLQECRGLLTLNLDHLVNVGGGNTMLGMLSPAFQNEDSRNGRLSLQEISVYNSNVGGHWDIGLQRMLYNSRTVSRMPGRLTELDNPMFAGNSRTITTALAINHSRRQLAALVYCLLQTEEGPGSIVARMPDEMWIHILHMIWATISR